MENSVLSFFKAEWKVSDTGLAHWASSLETTNLVVSTLHKDSWIILKAVSCERPELITLREHLGSPPLPVFGGARVVHPFKFSMLFFCLSFSCVLCAQYCQCLWIVHYWSLLVCLCLLITRTGLHKRQLTWTWVFLYYYERGTAMKVLFFVGINFHGFVKNYKFVDS